MRILMIIFNLCRLDEQSFRSILSKRLEWCSAMKFCPISNGTYYMQDLGTFNVCHHTLF